MGVYLFLPFWDINVRIFRAQAMECMPPQTRPWLILLSERVVGRGATTYINSQGIIYSNQKTLAGLGVWREWEGGRGGGSNASCCITQDSEPNTPPAELFRPLNKADLTNSRAARAQESSYTSSFCSTEK